jgi:O-antigen ligase
VYKTSLINNRDLSTELPTKQYKRRYSGSAAISQSSISPATVEKKISASWAALIITGMILVLASFGWYSRDYYAVVDPVLSSSTLFGRAIPLLLSAIISIIAAPKPRIRLIGHLFSPPFVFFLWYIGIGLLSGVLSGISPLYSLWKGIELTVVIIWAVVIASWLEAPGSKRLLRLCFIAIFWSIVAVNIWTLYSNYGFPQNWFVDFLVRPRLEGDFPIINPLQLGTMAAYVITMSLVLGRRNKRFLYFLIALPAVSILIHTQARSAAVGLLFAVFLLLFSRRRLNPLNSVIIVVLLLMFFTFSMSNEAFGAYFFRAQSSVWLDTQDIDIPRLFSGRIDMSWADSLEMFSSSPVIGYGLINLSRFFKEQIFGVDNTYLQLLLASGVLGAIPLIYYFVATAARWLFAVFQPPDSLADETLQDVYEFGLVSFAIVMTRTFFVNELAFYGIGQTLFLLSVLSLQLVNNFGAESGKEKTYTNVQQNPWVDAKK